MTPFPNAQDYILAVQEPERVFKRPALQQAKFALHPALHIPIPASGNVAVVFKAQVDGSEQAMRFFIREDASSRIRYNELGLHVKIHGLSNCVATATWIDEAIEINKAAWPMVEMQWVDGRTLDAYVAYLAEQGDEHSLRNLAMTWRDLIAKLQEAEFAHGDLQHGNVLVDTSSNLRLVDFDGSWITPFHGMDPPHETGHPNYQRTGREWGRWMDTFPGLVIYLALLGLSKNSTPWSELSNGENILFSQDDFVPPFRTPAWKFLEGLRDPEIDDLAGRLKLACQPGWTASGSLEDLLAAGRRQNPTLPPTERATPPPTQPATPGIAPPVRSDQPGAGRSDSTSYEVPDWLSALTSARSDEAGSPPPSLSQHQYSLPPVRADHSIPPPPNINHESPTQHMQAAPVVAAPPWFGGGAEVANDRSKEGMTKAQVSVLALFLGVMTGIAAFVIVMLSSTVRHPEGSAALAGFITFGVAFPLIYALLRRMKT